MENTNHEELDNRLTKNRNYLVELVKAFGEVSINVGKNNGIKTKVILITVYNYVIQQLDQVKIPFPFGETRGSSKKFINKSLGIDHICIIVTEALMNYMDAYANEKGDEQKIKQVGEWIAEKQRWIDDKFLFYTGDELIPFLEVDWKSKKKREAKIDPEKLEKCVYVLSDMGYESVKDMAAMKELFWDFAIRRSIIGAHMKAAIELITTDKLAKNYLNSHLMMFNNLVKKRLLDPHLELEEQGLMKLYGRAYETYKQHVAKVKEEAQEEIREIKCEAGRNNKIAKQLKILLENPQSNLMDCYDLTDELSIVQYLSWYRTWNRPIKPWVVKALEEQRYTEPGALDLFKEKVELHNAIIEKILNRIAIEKSEKIEI